MSIMTSRSSQRPCTPSIWTRHKIFLVSQLLHLIINTNTDYRLEMQIQIQIHNEIQMRHPSHASQDFTCDQTSPFTMRYRYKLTIKYRWKYMIPKWVTHLIFPTASKNGCPCQIKLTLCLLLLVHVTKSWLQHRSHLANPRSTTTSTTKTSNTSITGSTGNNVWPRGGGGSVRLCIIFEWLTTTTITTTTLPRPTWSKLNVVVEV